MCLALLPGTSPTYNIEHFIKASSEFPLKCVQSNKMLDCLSLSVAV